jgi:hypothetical protein
MKSLINQLGESQLESDLQEIMAEFEVSRKLAIWHYEIFMALLEE